MVILVASLKLQGKLYLFLVLLHGYLHFLYVLEIERCAGYAFEESLVFCFLAIEVRVGSPASSFVLIDCGKRFLTAFYNKSVSSS